MQVKTGSPPETAGGLPVFADKWRLQKITGIPGFYEVITCTE